MNSYQNNLFSLDKDNPSTSHIKKAPDFNSFDEALDCHALGKFIRGEDNNKRRRIDDDYTPSNRRPIALYALTPDWVKLNQSRSRHY